ncbi:MAG: type II toxin-antitoxin system VapC family toxin [Thermomicrobiales bacterium]
MPRIVDTSVAIKWVMRESFTDNALALRDDSLRRKDPIYVPPLLMYEATNVLYDFARQGKITETDADQGLQEIAAVVTVARLDLLQLVNAMSLARSANKQDTYDSQFLALALDTGYELWTADRRYERAVGKRLLVQGRSLLHLIETFLV